jgi:hypothetical protein
MGILTVASVTILFGILMAYYNDLVTRDKEQTTIDVENILIGAIPSRNNYGVDYILLQCHSYV